MVAVQLGGTSTAKTLAAGMEEETAAVVSSRETAAEITVTGQAEEAGMLEEEMLEEEITEVTTTEILKRDTKRCATCDVSSNKKPCCLIRHQGFLFRFVLFK